MNSIKTRLIEAGRKRYLGILDTCRVPTVKGPLKIKHESTPDADYLNAYLFNDFARILQKRSKPGLP